MADVSHVISLGLGSPADIPHFILFGLSTHPDVVEAEAIVIRVEAGTRVLGVEHMTRTLTVIDVRGDDV